MLDKAWSRVLLVEDSPDSQKIVKAALEGEARVTVVSDLSKASKKLKTETFDLLLLDVDLPDGSAFDLMSEISLTHMICKPRILFLTGNDELKDKLAGFSLGADDYLVKPIHPIELRARVQSHLRSRREALEASQQLQMGPLRLNVLTGSIEVLREDGAVEIPAVPAEFRILSALAKNQGHALSREYLQSVSDGAMDTHVSKLKQKLERFGLDVESLYGFGYRLKLKERRVG